MVMKLSLKNEPTVLSRIQGSLYGVMIGDAMGMPVEMMTPEEILLKTNGLGITGFVFPIQRRAEGNIQLNPGDTTDDTQLTLAVLKSLIRRKQFDIVDIALSHVECLNSAIGWGKTTRNGIEEIQKYFLSNGEMGRSPFDEPKFIIGQGGGNGVAMKIASIAWMGLIKNNRIISMHKTDNYLFPLFQNFTNNISALGKLTHADKRSWAATCALICAMIYTNSTGWYITEKNISFKERNEYCLRHLQTILSEVKRFELNYKTSQNNNAKSFSLHLKELLDMNLLFGPIENLRKKIGTGCIATESVVFAIAVFLRNPTDFQKGILEAVNSGGDCDSTASMVGSLIGSVVGVEGIPKEWKNFNPKFKEAEILGKEFYDVFKR